MIIIENLTGLEQLMNKEFWFSCFPLKIEEGDGSPVRACAITEGFESLPAGQAGLKSLKVSCMKPVCSQLALVTYSHFQLVTRTARTRPFTSYNSLISALNNRMSPSSAFPAISRMSSIFAGTRLSGSHSSVSTETAAQGNPI